LSSIPNKNQGYKPLAGGFDVQFIEQRPESRAGFALDITLGIRMTLRPAFAALDPLLFSATAMAQYYQDPEAALTEYIAAYKSRDVPRFLAAIDFEFEAKETLSKRPGTSQEPSDAEVLASAGKLQSELRAHFDKFGFKAATLDNCKRVTKFEDTETLVRIVLSCSDARGSSVFPVRIVKFPEGWRAVRG
jgi:hypothetical protein